MVTKKFIDPKLFRQEKLYPWLFMQQGPIEAVDFFWLDMQGYELTMLKKSNIAKTATAIYLEVSFIEAFKNQYLYHDVKQWMQEQGFFLSDTDFNENKIEEYLEKRICYFGNALFIKRFS